jgi:hypothetical protein
MKIKFSDLKDISENLEKGNDQFLINYLNSFEGYNTYEKFKNILISWETDTSYQLSLNLDNKNVKIQLDHIIKNIPTLEYESIIEKDDVKITLQIPREFSFSDDVIPIYQIIKNVEIFGIFLDFEKNTMGEKIKIIDNLPANVYNTIIQEIIKNDKIFSFEGETLSRLRLNFMGNDPYIFLRGLFLSYGRDYFRDIIFYLSKRIDGQILMNSTIQDIDFYIEKYNDEMKESQGNTLMIGQI